MGNKKLLKRCILPIVLISLCIPLDSIDVFWAVVKNRVEADAQYFWLHSIIYGGIFGGYFISVMAALPYGMKSASAVITQNEKEGDFSIELSLECEREVSSREIEHYKKILAK